MRQIRLIYFSRATRDMTLADLKSILEIARDNNTGLGICGMLCYENRYFLQALEGERSKVNELYLDIIDDPRHDEAIIVSYEEIQTSMFEDWTMGYAASSAQFASMLQELKQQEFEPADMSHEQALSFLQEMAKHQTKV